MIDTILFATGNPAKKKLMTPIFAEYGLECLTLADVGLTNASPPETGTTPAENALIKARAFHSKAYPLVFGADTGLEIDALNGEPGLMARRWNGYFPDDIDDETWLDYLLKRLEGVPFHQRTARFTSAWALIDPHGNEHIFEIPYPFRIATRILRPITPGAPTSAVRVGAGGDLSHRSKQLSKDMKRWGILDTLQLAE